MNFRRYSDSPRLTYPRSVAVATATATITSISVATTTISPSPSKTSATRTSEKIPYPNSEAQLGTLDGRPCKRKEGRKKERQKEKESRKEGKAEARTATHNQLEIRQTRLIYYYYRMCNKLTIFFINVINSCGSATLSV